MEKDSRNVWEIPAKEEDLEMISAMKEITLRFGKKDDYRTREAYKTLRTNIEFSGSDIKTIAITSCTPNEGKSSVAMELAKAFAEAGKKTILVDADLRKSVLVGRYKTGAVKHGLTHALIGRESLEKVVCMTNVQNLYIIFSGPVPPNPSELLGGMKFQGTIQKLREKFDYVIVDTPPLGSRTGRKNRAMKSLPEILCISPTTARIFSAVFIRRRAAITPPRWKNPISLKQFRI